jgi:hypothetical protein
MFHTVGLRGFELDTRAPGLRFILGGRDEPGVADHESREVGGKTWNGFEFHALDIRHGYDEHPVRQVDQELLANQNLLHFGSRGPGVYFRHVKFKALRRPICEVNGDCSRHSLARGQ